MKAALLVAAALASAACNVGGRDDRGDGATDGIGLTEDGGDDEDSGEPEGQCAELSVGASPLRRLTRSQYDNTVADLLGVAGNPSAGLAPDEKVGPFFSNLTAPVGELLAEQYMKAAEDLAAQAVVELDALAPCDGVDLHACGAAFVDDFGLRAFRRPLHADEREVMLAVFEHGLADEGYATGIRLSVEAFLQSPQLLYHLELGVPPEDDGLVVPLDSWQLASRLSYFLWDSMPDDELFRAAAEDELADRDALREQALRMLDSPKAASAIASFHLQWLGLDDLATLEKDPAVYNGVDDDVRTAMRNETARFVDYVVREDDGRLETLLTAPYSFLEGDLFVLYGVEVPPDHDPGRPVELDPGERAGLLTQASVLATHAHADQSSPIRRGKLVRQNILCQPLAPPPPDVNVTPPELDPNASTRERFEQHRTDPTCAACHELIDPIGFGFEGYDGVGVFRSQEAGKPVDASGVLSGTDDVDGSFDGAVELAHILAGSEQVRDCVAQQWFNYGFGRVHGEHDDCAFDHIASAFEESDGDVRELLVAIVVSDTFRHRRTQEAP